MSAAGYKGTTETQEIVGTSAAAAYGEINEGYEDAGEGMYEDEVWDAEPAAAEAAPASAKHDFVPGDVAIDDIIEEEDMLAEADDNYDVEAAVHETSPEDNVPTDPDPSRVSSAEQNTFSIFGSQISSAKSAGRAADPNAVPAGLMEGPLAEAGEAADPVAGGSMYSMRGGGIEKRRPTLEDVLANTGSSFTLPTMMAAAREGPHVQPQQQTQHFDY